MKKAWNVWNDWSLILRIVVFLAIGTVLGIFCGDGLTVISLLGNIFVAALRAVAPILVFFLIISALANAKAPGTMKTVIVLYLVATFAAALIAVAASFIFPIGIVLADPPDTAVSAPEGIGAVLTTLVLNVFTNPVESLVNGNFLGILAWAVALGVALRQAKQSTKDVFADVSDAIVKLVQVVISFAPFGIMGLVYTAVSENGLDIFINYGSLILLLVGSMLVVAFIAYPLIVAICTHRNPYPLVFRCLKDSAITAFFTRSSAANIPVNMELCRKLGLNRDSYSVSIPLGATINMGGAAVTISIMTMATVHLLGIQVDFATALVLSLLAALGACGASGVAGGSLLLIPMACSLFGIGGDVAMQVVGVGFIIGVIQDSCETALNSSSDVLFTATAEYRERRKKGIPFEMGKDAPVPEPILAQDAMADGNPLPSHLAARPTASGNNDADGRGSDASRRNGNPGGDVGARK